FLRIEVNRGIHPLIVECDAQNEYTDSYYDATQNKYGADLKSTLHNIIKGHTEYSYSDLWNILRDTDEDPNNTDNVILLYTGWSYDKYNNGGDPDEWNREHVWAKSHGDFGTSPPAGTDVHHIRPTDVSVNSKRGNLDFDNGGTEYIDGDGATGCYYDDDSWEPRDAVKGDVARMMYYMVVRYEGEEGYDLELVDYTPSTTGNDPVFGKQSTLYQWHWIDSVDDWERRRNDRIYNNWQHNRNPFIDHPEFADRLPSISGQPLEQSPEIAVAPVSVDMGVIGFNSRSEYYIAIINTGNQDLNVSQIHSTNPDFSLEYTSKVLAPETYDCLGVFFDSQTEEGEFSTTIQLTTNDADEGFVEIPVTVQVSESANVITNTPLPTAFALFQNYPNPFGRSERTTTIRYRLNVSGLPVKLTLYDLCGRQVAQLVNDRQTIGEHAVRFNASDLPSGIYWYRLETGTGMVRTRKMVILK
ncbi:MAG TPA: T9SS type A sorting domain-containing protein, partial [Caldithrix abyssi]|nr:T9SS type A sorting domain-containing protein [Caldithrix abyssi]